MSETNFIRAAYLVLPGIIVATGHLGGLVFIAIFWLLSERLIRSGY